MAEARQRGEAQVLTPLVERCGCTRLRKSPPDEKGHGDDRTRCYDFPYLTDGASSGTSLRAVAYMPSDHHETSLRNEFEALCREHGKAALEIVRRKLGTQLRRRLDSQDVVQDAFLVALGLYESNRDQLRKPNGAFRNWLAAIIENRIRKLADHHLGAQRRSLEREVDLGDHVDQLRDPDARTPSKLTAATEQREAIANALSKLPPRHREVIELVPARLHRCKRGEMHRNRRWAAAAR